MTFALLVRLEAQPGEEADVESYIRGCPSVVQEALSMVGGGAKSLEAFAVRPNSFSKASKCPNGTAQGGSQNTGRCLFPNPHDEDLDADLEYPATLIPAEEPISSDTPAESRRISPQNLTPAAAPQDICRNAPTRLGACLRTDSPSTA